MPNENVDASVLIPILKQIPIFAELDESIHREIIERIVLMYYPKGYTIFNQDDEGDALYIVKEGGVEIYHPAKDEGDLDQKIAEIKKGGFFGEMALISEETRNASARTMEESEVFILNKSDFAKLLETNTTLAQHVSATMVSRLNENNKA